MSTILKELEKTLPKDSEISDMKFEASELVLYTKSKEFFRNGEPVIKAMVDNLKKRIELRPDPSITMDAEEAKKIIKEIVAEEAGIQEIYFEPELGKVIIGCLKPGLVIGKGGEIYRKIKNETLWLPKIERTPAIKSDIVMAVRGLLHTELDYRKKFLNKVGQAISVRKEVDDEWVRLSCLGAGRQVGRSCFMVQTPYSNVLLDFGVNTSNDTPPQIDAPEFNIDKINAVVLSHAHLDHCLTPDTLVQLSDGDIQQISEISTGQGVEALDFKNSMKIEAIPAIQRGCIEAPNPIYEVRTKTKRLKATGNHPVFVLDKDGKFVIKHVEQLRVGDFVATPRKVDVDGSEQTLPTLKGVKRVLGKEIAQTLGYILGDGCNRESGTVILTDKNLGNIKFYSSLLESVGIKSKISVKERNRLNVYSVEFKSWLDKIDRFILSRSPTRKIPRVVCKSKKEVIAMFLRGLYDAEGCVKHHSIVLSTSSENIATATQMLLLRFGIISHIYDHDQSKSTFGGGKAYQLCMSDPESIKTFSKLIGFSDLNKLEKLNSILNVIGKGIGKKMDLIPIGKDAILGIGYELGLRKIDLRKLGINYYHYSKHFPTREKLLEICKQLSKAAKSKGVRSERLDLLTKLASSDILWDPVTSAKIIETDSKKVYDLTVPGHSNYIANGIFVHNCGFIPYLYENGFTGPLYCTPPTRDLMVLLCLDYVDIAQKEGKKSWYSKSAVEKAVKHSITLEYGEVSDITEDIRLTFQPAGHLLGSALCHLHVGKGLHNILYTGDLKYCPTRLFDPAYTDFKRIETLIIEATYGRAEDVTQPRPIAEKDMIDTILKTVERGGKVLIPSFAVGRAQEVMAILGGMDFQYPVWVEGMTWDATAIHTAYPEYMSRSIQREIFHKGKNPFLADIFHNPAPREREAIIDGKQPGVVLATSGMMVGGPVLEYFKGLAHDPKNTLMFVGYQGEGTLGRKIQSGLKEVPVSSGGKNKTVAVEMEVKSISGLSGHSDRSQLVNFMRRLGSRPERIITNHGDKNSCIELA
ncbi:MAG TPA: LAGLIDADG family homing endonuclease, partial [archaeon]|nr:LAGLIDADG family homing endonuclease [archaeon]